MLAKINCEKFHQKKIRFANTLNVVLGTNTGDNSIGKSMLLHSLTGFEKDGEKLEPKIKSGYQKYAKENGLKIKKHLKCLFPKRF